MTRRNDTSEHTPEEIANVVDSLRKSYDPKASRLATCVYLLLSPTQARVLHEAAERAGVLLEPGPVDLGAGCVLVAERDLGRMADLDGTLIQRLRFGVTEAEAREWKAATG